MKQEIEKIILETIEASKATDLILTLFPKWRYNVDELEIGVKIVSLDKNGQLSTCRKELEGNGVYFMYLDNYNEVVETPVKYVFESEFLKIMEVNK